MDLNGPSLAPRFCVAIYEGKKPWEQGWWPSQAPREKKRVALQQNYIFSLFYRIKPPFDRVYQEEHVRSTQNNSTF